MIKTMPEAPSPTLIRAVYQLTEKEFYEAQVQHVGLSGKILQTIGVILVASGVVSLFAHQYTSATIGIIIGAILLLNLRLSAKLAFRKEASLRLEATWIVSEFGIEFSSSRGKSNLNWSAFVRYVETKHLFVLYFQSRIFNLIPKRAFLPEDVDSLRQMLQQHVATKAVDRVGNLSTKVFLFFLVVVAAIVLVFLAIHGINH